MNTCYCAQGDYCTQTFDDADAPATQPPTNPFPTLPVTCKAQSPTNGWLKALIPAPSMAEEALEATGLAGEVGLEAVLLIITIPAVLWLGYRRLARDRRRRLVNSPFHPAYFHHYQVGGKRSKKTKAKKQAYELAP